jgi:hypothetical protein
MLTEQNSKETNNTATHRILQRLAFIYLQHATGCIRQLPARVLLCPAPIKGGLSRLHRLDIVIHIQYGLQWLHMHQVHALCAPLEVKRLPRVHVSRVHDVRAVPLNVVIQENVL